ncbi:MAG: cytochrome C [Candidatus Melainabacteria bacterium HGW-Melainabacteria-1]|nr:MAG: cytochrome C [Candidatus Melainabacteria bacterium HGW-Melainabacteria-1]
MIPVKFFTLSHFGALSAAVALIALLAGCPQSSDQTDPAASSANTTSQSAPASAAPVADEGKGIGPVSSVTLAALDPALATEGQKLFESKCASCHKMDASKYVGPGLKGITERRKPEWIMNMILNSAEMTQKDPEAKKLFAQYMIQMPNQNMDEKSSRAVLEYFRSVDAK